MVAVHEYGIEISPARNADEAGEMRSELKQSPYETTFTGMVSCESVRDSFLPAARKQVIGRQG